MNGRPTAAAAGKIDVGGDLTVNRLGFGAMRITGPGIWGDPPDRDRAREALQRAVAPLPDVAGRELPVLGRVVDALDEPFGLLSL